MPKTRLEDDERRQRTIDAVVTFTALMHAYERGELATAATAQAELAQLGVVIRFARLKVGNRKGGRNE